MWTTLIWKLMEEKDQNYTKAGLHLWMLPHQFRPMCRISLCISEFLPDHLSVTSLQRRCRGKLEAASAQTYKTKKTPHFKSRKGSAEMSVRNSPVTVVTKALLVLFPPPVLTISTYNCAISLEPLALFLPLSIHFSGVMCNCPSAPPPPWLRSFLPFCL